ncbi:MAG: sigma-70 family RNA polymerase sigma factor [Planctomycetota bacterium]
MTLTDDHDHPAFEQVLNAAKDGDQVAIGEIFELFYPRVKRLVHRSLATDLRNSRPWLTARFSTGDVVQEVFRSVLGDLESFGGSTERAFTGYLTMVVRNRIIDAIRFHEAERRDGRRGALPIAEEEHEGASDSPANAAANAEELDRFHEALKTFPEREQLLLRARFEETASFAELTEQLGYPSESTARRAYFAAQARLAVQLRDRSELDHSSSDEEDR